ncbi:hypothetical protein CUMW_008540 [Citrus unshiu]|nr:hypothetical protein CUMW_008540 [Citrus unshiu]
MIRGGNCFINAQFGCANYEYVKIQLRSQIVLIIAVRTCYWKLAKCCSVVSYELLNRWGNQAMKQDSGDSPVSDLEIGFDGLKWA